MYRGVPSSKTSKKVVYIFRSESCPACRSIARSLNETVGEFKESVFFHDVETSGGRAEKLVDKYSVDTLPAMIVVDGVDGHVLARFDSTADGASQRLEKLRRYLQQ